MRFSSSQLKKLPQKAREKAVRLAEKSDYHLGAVRQLYARKDELYAQINGIVLERAELIARIGGRSLSDESERDFKTRKEAVQAEIKRFEDALPKFRETWEVSEAILKRCSNFIDAHSEFRPAKSVAPAKTIEDVRAKISLLQQQRAAVLKSPLPRDQYLDVIRKSLDDEARIGQPLFDGRVHDSDPFRLQDLIRSDGRSPGVGAGVFLLSLFREEILAKLSTMVPPDGPQTLTADQRHRKIAKIETDILDLERSEEAFIEAAIESSNADGWPIARRIDANPLAILGVEA